MLTGNTRSFGSGSDDIWLIKVNENFDSEFHREWGGVHNDYAHKIISTKDENVVLIGDSWDAPGSRTDIVLAKYDLQGNNLWVSHFGNEFNDFTFGIKETSDQGFIITGIKVSDEGSIFVIKTNSEGVLQW